METLLAVALGVGLAAAAGLRVFVPLLALNLASRFELVNLATSLEWVGSTGALVAFSVAAVVEVAGYMIPLVDNLLDALATPAAAIAGTLVMGAALVDFDPLWAWALAIIAGGGTAAMVQGATVALRATSTLTTGGVGNPVVGASEAAGSVGLSLLAIALPVIALFAVVGSVVYLLWRFPRVLGKVFRRGRNRRKGVDVP